MNETATGNFWANVSECRIYCKVQARNKKLIRAMNEETRSEILLLYSDKANDGMLRDLQSVMKKLRENGKGI